MPESAETSPERRRRSWLANRPVGMRILAAIGIASITAIGVGALAVSDLRELESAPPS